MAFDNETRPQLVDLVSRWERGRRDEFEVHKDVLRKTLAQQDGIARIQAGYDGWGDNGHIVSMTFLDEENQEVPTTAHELVKAVERFVFWLLSNEHSGWRTEQGSYGIMTLDGKTLTGHLEHWWRVEECEQTVF